MDKWYRHITFDTEKKSINSVNMKIKIERTGSLLDGEQAWLLAPQYKGGKKNFQRKRGDVLNTERACGIFALGVNGQYDLRQTELKTLLLPLIEIEKIFLKGIKLDFTRRKILAEERVAKRRKPLPMETVSVNRLNPKTIFRLRCSFLRFRSDIFGDELGEQGTAEHPSASEYWEQKVTPSRISSQAGNIKCPPGLAEEWKRYEDYRCGDFYAGPGVAYRKKVIKRTTFSLDRGLFNQLVLFCTSEEGLTEVTFLDLVNYSRVLRYRQHYFAQRTEGGYTSFGHLCVQLAVMSRYLAAAGRLRDPEDPSRRYPYLPDSKSQHSLWGSFYRLKADTKIAGSKEGKIVKSYVVKDMEPTDLLNLGIEAWSSRPRMRASNRRLSSRKQMFYLRRRAAMFFILAPFMPLRARNWREMRWGKNLWRNEQGLWVIHFEGTELKVAMQKEEVNVYHHELPLLASEWIDRWRVELSEWLSTAPKDIETVVPYVFPQRKNNLKGQDRHWGMTEYSGFRSAINSLVLDLRRHQFPPHQIRHIVVTSVIKDATLAEAQLAAELVGDTLQTIIKEYFRLDTKKMRSSYFSTLIPTAPEDIVRANTDSDGLEAADD